MSDSLQPHELYSPWNSPGQNDGEGSHSLLHGIFQIQGSNSGRPHFRWILYQLSHQGSCSVASNSLWWHGLQTPRLLCPWNSPGKNVRMGCHFFLQEIFPTRDRTQVSCIVGGFFTIWATKEALVGIVCLIIIHFNILKYFPLFVLFFHDIFDLLLLFSPLSQILPKPLAVFF